MRSPVTANGGSGAQPERRTGVAAGQTAGTGRSSLTMPDDGSLRGPILILLFVALLAILIGGAAVLLGYGRYQFQHHENKAVSVPPRRSLPSGQLGQSSGASAHWCALASSAALPRI